jgi:SAM-dependent methyltransferase
MSDHQESAYAIYHEWKSWSDDSFGVASPELHAAYAVLLRSHTRITSGPAIDFGFGNGEMLTTLRASGFQAVGVERNPLLREIAFRKGYETAESLTDDRLPASGTLAVVTAFHVLEHLDRDMLRQTLARFAELLQPGGIVLAAFPNGDSPFSASAFNGDITHVTWIGSSMAEQLGEMSGLKLAAFHEFPSLTTYSRQPLVRLKGTLRSFMEKLLSGILSRVYYGGAGKVLSPVAVAVWAKK